MLHLTQHRDNLAKIVGLHQTDNLIVAIPLHLSDVIDNNTLGILNHATLARTANINLISLTITIHHHGGICCHHHVPIRLNLVGHIRGTTIREQHHSSTLLVETLCLNPNLQTHLKPTLLLHSMHLNRQTLELLFRR